MWSRDECKFYVAGRAFPKIPNDYFAKIEWNNKVEAKSLYVEEYVSHKLNTGTFLVTGVAGPGVTSQYISSVDTQEYFLIFGRSIHCQSVMCHISRHVSIFIKLVT